MKKYWWKEEKKEVVTRKGNYKIGQYYKTTDGYEGFIFEIGENGTPSKLISLKFTKHGNGSWNDEKKYFDEIKAKGSKEYFPTQEELMRAWSWHDLIDAEVDRVRKEGIEADHIKTDENETAYWCWSSSQYSSSTARYVTTCTGNVYDSGKAGTYAYNRVRAFVAL